MMPQIFYQQWMATLIHNTIMTFLNHLSYNLLQSHNEKKTEFSSFKKFDVNIFARAL